MYRYLLPCLYLTAVTSAPQDNLNLIQTQPAVEYTQSPLPTNSTYRESDVVPSVTPGTVPDNQSTQNSLSEETTTELDAASSTDIPEVTTQKKITQYTYKPKPTPKTFSKPRPRVITNLNYYNKTKYISSKNLIDKDDKRKFKSRCRCEKIWNCPKLQITIPRCPNEYFLCCF